VTQEKRVDQQQTGIEVPYERLDPQTLRRLVEEFVTRDGADWDQAGCALAEKVEQVLRQLRERKVQVVFDLSAQTANIVVCR